MNLAHIHIVLNHIPSLGTMACLVLLAAAIRSRNEALKKGVLQALVLITVSVLPTYITGLEAQRVVSNRPAVSRAMIQVHHNAAMITLLLMTVAGTLAWFALWEYRRFNRASSVTSIGTLLFTAAATAAIFFTAGLGGKVSHPEIRDGLDDSVLESAGWREPIEIFVNDHAWIWPASETLHFLGMALLFGISLLLLLRMLGMMKSIPFSGIHRLLPLGILGFVFNVLTGMMFFVAAPGLYLGKIGFHIKIASIVIAAIPLLYFTLFDDPWKTDSNVSASATSKVAAVVTFALLVIVVIYGRFLPFLVYW
jgi:hypothetical protein